MKYLITGASDGFGAQMLSSLPEGSLGISRKSGHNICKSAERKEIVRKSLEFEVFVNFAHIDFFQTKLLYEVAGEWIAQNKSGCIINIGSYATFANAPSYQQWIVSKYSLDLANRQYCQQIQTGTLPFRMTLLRLGLLDTPKNRAKSYWPGFGHRPEEVAATLKYIADPSREQNINEMTIHALAVKPSNNSSS